MRPSCAHPAAPDAHRQLQVRREPQAGGAMRPQQPRPEQGPVGRARTPRCRTPRTRRVPYSQPARQAAPARRRPWQVQGQEQGIGPQASDKGPAARAAAPAPAAGEAGGAVPARRARPCSGPCRGPPRGGERQAGELVADVRAQLLAALWSPARARAAMHQALRQLGPRGLTAAAWRARAEALLAEEAAGP